MNFERYDFRAIGIFSDWISSDLFVDFSSPRGDVVLDFEIPKGFA